MKQYFLKAAGALFTFSLAALAGFGQEDKGSGTPSNQDVIVIKPKPATNTKFTIEIKGEDVKINGKPISEYKGDNIDITITRESNARSLSEADAMRAPRNRFRGGSTVYGYRSQNNVSVNTHSNKAFLGVATEKNDDGEGVKIVNVTDESAAEKAGLKEDDIITKINDTKINTPDGLMTVISTCKPDEKIAVTYKRNDKEQKTTATLSKKKNAEVFEFEDALQNFNSSNNDWWVFGKPMLGLKAQETEDGKGLKVLDVTDESAADKSGIKEGDVITSFDGTEVNNIDKLRDLSKPAMSKGHFKINLLRDGKAQEIEVKIPKKLKTTSL